LICEPSLSLVNAGRTARPSLDARPAAAAEIDHLQQGAPAEFAEAAVRSVVVRLTEAATNLHQ
jgi:hypothetical protein